MRCIKTLAVIFIVFLAASCGNQNQDNEIPTDVVNNPNSADGKADMGTLPVFSFEHEEHDFGKIIQGEQVSYSYKFTNTGKSDLIISSAKATCGCTVPSYPKTPVKPGESAVIEVTFSSEGKKGKQHKTITLTANTQPNTKVLSIKAEVIVPEK